MGNEEKKGKERLADIWQKASVVGKDLGKKVADGVQTGTKSLMESAQNTSYSLKMKKYNPVFPKQYKSREFNIPDVIAIASDVDRRTVDVCEGAIGWMNIENGLEILYLYVDFIPKSGLNFIPNAVCGEIYYVDRFQPGRYLRVDCVFSKAHEEKLAELEHIAYSLGAKSCSIEIMESKSASEMLQKKGSLKLSTTKGLGNSSIESNYSQQNTSKLSGKTTSHFEGSGEPKQPKLKWFAHDDNIQRLIEMRLDSKHTITSKVLELEGASSATMSQSVAKSIDLAIAKIGGKVNIHLENRAAEEHYSKLIYSLEF